MENKNMIWVWVLVAAIVMLVVVRFIGFLVTVVLTVVCFVAIALSLWKLGEWGWEELKKAGYVK